MSAPKRRKYMPLPDYRPCNGNYVCPGAVVDPRYEIYLSHFVGGDGKEFTFYATTRLYNIAAQLETHNPRSKEIVMFDTWTNAVFSGGWP